MYPLLRTTAVIFIVLGMLVMVGGLVIGVNGWLSNPTTPTTNTGSFSFPDMRAIARTGSIAVGGIAFFQGLIIAAVGQLAWVFADIAVNTRETAQLLRGLRRSSSNTN